MPENRIEKKYLKLICTFKAADLFSKASLTAAPNDRIFGNMFEQERLVRSVSNGFLYALKSY